jgi:hypothetical protein
MGKFKWYTTRPSSGSSGTSIGYITLTADGVAVFTHVTSTAVTHTSKYWEKVDENTL